MGHDNAGSTERDISDTRAVSYDAPNSRCPLSKHNLVSFRWRLLLCTEHKPLRGGDGGVKLGHEPQEELAVEGLAQRGGLVVRLLYRLQHHRVRAVHLRAYRRAMPSRQTDVVRMHEQGKRSHHDVRNKARTGAREP